MDILPEVGGHYRLIMDTSEFKSHNQCTFLIVEANSHVRYTWDHDGEVSEIDVTFSATQKDTTVLIEHSGFQKQQSIAMHDQGWDSNIAGFKLFLSKTI
jgi:uncharacterized protein YndB with AHSA1/START domain